jgi:hypothetical protein
MFKLNGLYFEKHHLKISHLGQNWLLEKWLTLKVSHSQKSE